MTRTCGFQTRILGQAPSRLPALKPLQRLGAPLNISSPRDLGTYLKVGDAAALLGVSPWTLRHWDRAGKLKSLRHPVNGYRLYRREELEALLVRAAGGDPRQETMK